MDFFSFGNLMISQLLGFHKLFRNFLGRSHIRQASVVPFSEGTCNPRKSLDINLSEQSLAAACKTKY